MVLSDPSDAGVQALKIAACVTQDGILTGFSDESILRLYERLPERWQPQKEIPFRVSANTGLSEIREAVRLAASDLEECQIIIVGRSKGAVCAMLGDFGFTLFVADGPMQEILDQIDRNTPEVAEETASLPATEPYSVGDPKNGIYHLNMRAALDFDENLTSKGLLLPFLEKRSFRRLTVICDHIPRWFDDTCKRLNLQSETHDTADRNGLKLVICPGN